MDIKTEIIKFCEQQAKTYQELADDYSDSGFGMAKARDMQHQADINWAKAAAFREVLQEIELIEEGIPGDEPTPPDLASCGHPRNEDGECDCSCWPERCFHLFPASEHANELTNTQLRRA